MKTLLASTCLAAALHALAGMDARAAECGDVSIAEMNWPSAGVAAHIDKIILETGYGCSASIVAGDTIPTFTAMNDTGQPDMAPELWVNSIRAPFNAAVKDGRLIEGAKILTDGGVEGWWIPKFLADAHPDIKTVRDALKHPDLFPAPEDPLKAAIYNCPSGWSCQISSANLYRALKAEEAGFELIDTGSAAGQESSITRAFEKKTGWLGYYWAPTPILGKYEMTKLSFGVPHDKAEWDSCTAVPDCPRPKVNAYPISDVYTVVTKQFADKAGVAMEYVKARAWDNGTINKVLAWQDEHRATNADAARYFLKTYPEMWKGWLKPEVAEKVQAAL